MVTDVPGRTVLVLSRTVVAVLVLLVAVIVFGGTRYVSLSGRLDVAQRRGERQEAIIADQARSLRAIERLANAFARLTSTDPAERAAAREELARLAAEAAQANRPTPTTRRSGPVTTSTTQPSRPGPSPTTSTTRASTTSTTRACVGAVVADVCPRAASAHNHHRRLM